jgi:hypothetical protein
MEISFFFLQETVVLAPKSNFRDHVQYSPVLYVIITQWLPFRV